MSELIDRKAAIRATWQEPSYTYPLNVLTEVRDRINALPTIPAPLWHRVEDELPNVDEKVLVFAVGKLDGFIGDTVIALTSMSDTNWLNHHEKVDKPYWLDPWQYFLTDYRITHWMPLPEPPKEDA